MKNKPKYSMWESIRYMLSLSWKYQKWVMGMLFILAFLQVGLNLAQLYVAPQILQKVESSAPLTELLVTTGTSRKTVWKYPVARHRRLL